MRDIENQIESLLSQMTTDEKISLCHANSKFTAGGVERLGIEEITTSDGPHGVREEMSRDNWDALNSEDDYCTYLPTATALAATWNPDLAGSFGEVLGAEARWRKKDIILGPGINIIRHPLCGRNFEYMSEDPELVSEMVVPLIKGIQTQDTAACVKHYALNNQELDRKNVNVEVSKRALFEIYLKGFQAAVCEGNAYSVMGAYNRYQNEFCCHSKYLVCDVLKGKWNFDGVYLSDWAGTHSTEEAVFNGLDLEMGTEKPYNEFYLADGFKELIKKNPEAEKELDDKVRRILRMLARINKLDGDRKQGSFNTKEHQQTAYEIATEAIVLLKNDGVLPLSEKVKNILVVGDNAVRKHAHGGNSCGVKAFYEVTLLDGIRNRFKDCNITYIKTSQPNFDYIPVDSMEISDMGSGSRAFKCEFFDNEAMEGTPVVHYQGAAEECEDYVAGRYSVVVNIPETSRYHFRVRGGNNISFTVEGANETKRNSEELILSGDYNKGDKVSITLESVGRGEEPLELLWSDGDENISLDKMLEKAREADCVIYCGGINHNYDVEEFDRKDMKLPEVQNIEIPALLKANENTIITMTAGAPVEMPWIDEAKAVLWNWYAGMEGGNAFADIIKGAVNPSGKMPYTLPKKLEDSPAVRYGEYQAGNCKYNDDIYVGYRGFDKDNIEPMFCFGHGLSYCDFEYTDLEVNSEDNVIKVSFNVKNIGDVVAKETVQLYVGQDCDAIECAPRELKIFKKVTLEAGEIKKIDMIIGKTELEVYDETTDTWVVASKKCNIEVGRSSRDIRLKKENVAINF